MTPQKGENVRATSEYVYLGAFTSAQAPHWMIALEKNDKMGIF